MNKDSFYLLTSELQQDTVAYYYYNPDMNCCGFGFNTADGGGFLPETHLSKKTYVYPIHLVQGKIPEKRGNPASLDVPVEVAEAAAIIAEFMGKNNLNNGQIAGMNFETNRTWILKRERTKTTEEDY